MKIFDFKEHYCSDIRGHCNCVDDEYYYFGLFFEYFIDYLLALDFKDFRTDQLQ